MQLDHISRRQFLATAATGVGSALLSTVPGYALCRSPRNGDLGIGIVGSGETANHHARIVTGTPGVRLRAICESPKSIHDLGMSVRPDVLRYSDYRALLRDEMIDAVVVAAHIDKRPDLVIAACRAGKDVFVEAPCARSGREAHAIVDAALVNGRIVEQVTVGPPHEVLAELCHVRSRAESFPVSATAVASVSPLYQWGEAAVFTHLDFVRRTLALGIPSHIKTLALPSNLGYYATSLRFAPEGLPRIRFEVRPLLGTRSVDTFHETVFRLPSGEIRVVWSAGPDEVERLGRRSRVFFQSVSKRDTTNLFAPINEAAITVAVLEQIAGSLRRGSA